mmetsp:Transcript_44341/g.50068  ORF Transcript_44341/g.50068 Transcript_44341/m.50068 type:complete len:250 (+) Transcript_44341:79-828(+)
MLSFHSTSLSFIAVVLVVLSTGTFLPNDVQLVTVVYAQVVGTEQIDQVVAQDGAGGGGSTDPVPAMEAPDSAMETPETADDDFVDIDITDEAMNGTSTMDEEEGDEFAAVSIGDEGNVTEVTEAPTFEPTTFEPVPTFEPTVTDRPTESPTTFLPTTTYPPSAADATGEVVVPPLVDTGAESNLTTQLPTVVDAPPTPTTVPADLTASPVQDWTDPVAVISGATTTVLSSSSIIAAVGLVVVSGLMVVC